MDSIEKFVEKFVSKKVNKQEAMEFFNSKSGADQKLVLSKIQEKISTKSQEEEKQLESSPEPLTDEATILKITTNATCNESQKKYLKDFVGQYEKKTHRSKCLAADYRDYFSDQRTPIYFNSFLKEIHYPITYKKAQGAYLEDVDNNKYIDITGDFGVNLFGHQPLFLKEAIKSQIDDGNALSGRYELTSEVSRLFCEITGHDRVAFCQSGTESLMTAVRISKAATGKDKIAVFDGSYHGHFDGFLNPFTPGISEVFTNQTLRMPYGKNESLDIIRQHSNELAAIIVEPVQSRFPDLQPREFLQQLRELTDKEGIILVFDEMITGFRVGPKGCQGDFEVDADLTTYGKILGGGITAGAVAGAKELMGWVDGGNWRYGDNSKPSMITYMAGTHTQNPLKMAATYAILKELKSKSPNLQEQLNRKTDNLVGEVNQYLKENQYPLDIVHYGSLFRFRFFMDQFTITEGLFLHLLNDHGIRYNLHGNCFLTAAHCDKDVDVIINAIKTCVDILFKEGFFYEDTNTKSPVKIISSINNKGNEIDVKVTEKVIDQIKGDLKDLLPHKIESTLQKTITDSPDKKIIVTELQEIIGELLHIPLEKLDPEETLDNYVEDSVMTMKIIQVISKKYGIKLFPVDTRNEDTIIKLSNFICLKFKTQISEYLQKNVASETTRNQKKEFDLRSEFINNIFKKYDIRLTDKSVNLMKIDKLTNYLIHSFTEQMQKFYEIEIPKKKETKNGGDVRIKKQSHQKIKIDDYIEFEQTEKVQQRKSPSRDMAIIGMSAAFPGAHNIDILWKNLINRKHSIEDRPGTRWKWDDFYSKGGEPGTTISKWGAFLEDFDKFDNEFFGISEKDASYTDPQVRLLLQESYKTFEDAGICVTDLARSDTGVFVGYEFSGYREYIKKIESLNIKELKASTYEPFLLANRISSYFDLKGPSEALHADCASSGVSVNRAYYSLLSGETDLALVGAVCLHFDKDDYIAANDLMSPDGTCKVFDDEVNGFAKGEGCGLILMKRLEDAEKDRDHIYAILKSSAQIHAGTPKNRSDINPDALTEAIDRCYELSDISPDNVDYIEVDGFCSKWGDSYEYSAVKKAFNTGSEKMMKKHCALGSLKANIGHLEPASGIASVIKVVKSLTKKQFPPTIGIDKINEFIDVQDDSHPIYLAQNTISFEDLEKVDPVRAGVTSIGGEGVFSHLLFEEYSAKPKIIKKNITPQLIVLSAKNRDRLDEVVSNYLHYIEENDKVQQYDLENIAYTLQVGREHMGERIVFIVSSKKELMDKLRDYINKKLDTINVFKGNKNIEELAKLQGEENEKYVQSLIKKTEWSKLAEVWVQGYEINWKQLYTSKRPIKVPLPTYPFERKRITFEDEVAVSSKNKEHESYDDGDPGDHHYINEGDKKSDVSGTIHLKGTELHYEINGDGPTIVFIHGMGLDSRMWTQQIEYFKKSYRVVVYDVRGYGRSSVYKNGSFSNIEDLRGLFEALKISHTHIVGFSMGAEIASGFTIKYPNYVKSLVLADGEFIDADETDGKTSAGDKEFWRRIYEKAMMGNITSALEIWKKSKYFKLSQKNITVTREIHNMIDSYSGWHWKNGMPIPAITHPVEEINKPTLIIAGENDLKSIQKSSDIMAKKISNSQKIILKNCGHMANMESPEKFNYAISEFLYSSEL